MRKMTGWLHAADAMDVDPPEYVHMNSVFNMKYSNIRLTELNNP